MQHFKLENEHCRQFAYDGRSYDTMPKKDLQSYALSCGLSPYQNKPELYKQLSALQGLIGDVSDKNDVLAQALRKFYTACCAVNSHVATNNPEMPWHDLTALELKEIAKALLIRFFSSVDIDHMTKHELVTILYEYMCSGQCAGKPPSVAPVVISQPPPIPQPLHVPQLPPVHQPQYAPAVAPQSLHVPQPQYAPAVAPQSQHISPIPPPPPPHISSIPPPPPHLSPIPPRPLPPLPLQQPLPQSISENMINALQTEYNHCQTERDKLQQLIVQTNETKNVLEQERAQLQQKLITTQAALEQKCTTILQQERAQWQKKLKDINDTLQDAKYKNGSELQQKIASLNVELKTLETRLAEQTKQNANLQTLTDTYSNQLAELRKRDTAATNEYITQYNAMQNQIDDLQTANTKLTIQNSELQNRLSSNKCDHDIKRLEHDIQTLQTELETERKHHTETIQKTSKVYTKYQNEINNLQRTLETKETELKQDYGNLSTLDSQLTRLNSENEILQTRLLAMNAENITLLEKSTKENNELKQLETDLDAKNTEIERMIKDMEVFTTQNAKLSTIIKQLQTQLASKDDELKQRIPQLTETIDTLKRQLVSNADEHKQELMQTITKLQQQLDAKNTEIEQALTEIKGITNQNNELTQTIQQLKTQMDAKNTEIFNIAEDMENKVRGMYQNYDAKQNELTQLKQQLVAEQNKLTKSENKNMELQELLYEQEQQIQNHLTILTGYKNTILNTGDIAIVVNVIKSMFNPLYSTSGNESEQFNLNQRLDAITNLKIECDEKLKQYQNAIINGIRNLLDSKLNDFPNQFLTQFGPFVDETTRNAIQIWSNNATQKSNELLQNNQILADIQLFISKHFEGLMKIDNTQFIGNAWKMLYQYFRLPDQQMQELDTWITNMNQGIINLQKALVDCQSRQEGGTSAMVLDIPQTQNEVVPMVIDIKQQPTVMTQLQPPVTPLPIISNECLEQISKYNQILQTVKSQIVGRLLFIIDANLNFDSKHASKLAMDFMTGLAELGIIDKLSISGTNCQNELKPIVETITQQINDAKRVMDTIATIQDPYISTLTAMNYGIFFEPTTFYEQAKTRLLRVYNEQQIYKLNNDRKQLAQPQRQQSLPPPPQQTLQQSLPPPSTQPMQLSSAAPIQPQRQRIQIVDPPRQQLYQHPSAYWACEQALFSYPPKGLRIETTYDNKSITRDEQPMEIVHRFISIMEKCLKSTTDQQKRELVEKYIKHLKSVNYSQIKTKKSIWFAGDNPNILKNTSPNTFCELLSDLGFIQCLYTNQNVSFSDMKGRTRQNASDIVSQTKETPRETYSFNNRTVYAFNNGIDILQNGKYYHYRGMPNYSFQIFKNLTQNTMRKDIKNIIQNYPQIL